MTGGDHQHGCWAIQRITGANLRGAGLQEVRCGRVLYAFRCAQYGKYRPNGNVHVDVGRSIKRIKHQKIFSLRILCRYWINIIHLFGSHRRQVTTPLGGFDEHFIGDDVQLFLRLTLNVLATCTAQHTDQLAFIDIMCDLLASDDDIADQASEIATDTRDRALFFDDELNHTLAHVQFPQNINLCWRRFQIRPLAEIQVPRPSPVNSGACAVQSPQGRSNRISEERHFPESILESVASGCVLTVRCAAPVRRSDWAGGGRTR